MQLNQATAKFKAGRFGDASQQVAHRALLHATHVGDLLLRHAGSTKLGDDLFPVHSGVSKHRVPDIIVERFADSQPPDDKKMGRDRTGFGERMLHARKRAGLTQEQVRDALKVAQSTLSELERDANGSSRTSEFARLYGCDPHWLATGDEAESLALTPDERALILAYRQQRAAGHLPMRKVAPSFTKTEDKGPRRHIGGIADYVARKTKRTKKKAA